MNASNAGCFATAGSVYLSCVKQLEPAVIAGGFEGAGRRAEKPDLARTYTFS